MGFRPTVVGLALLCVGCGGGSSPGDSSFWGRDAGGSDTPTMVIDTGPPPEIEMHRSFLTPQAGGRFVYVANPARDTVAVIDSTSLSIQSVEVGRRPTYLMTVTGRDEAIVLNVGSNSASILRTTTGTGTRVSSVPVFQGANAIAIAPDGRHAIVYLDTNVPGASTSGGSFQDLALITLEPGMDRVVQLTVGFRPVDVLFSADSSAAFVVTEDGISILRFADITGPTIVPNVSLSDRDIVMPGDAGMGSDAQTDGGSDAGPDAAADSGADAESDAEAGSDSGSEVGADAGSDGGLDGALDSGSTDSGGPVDSGSVQDTGTVEPTDPPRDVSITPDGRFALARTEGSARVTLVDLRSRVLRTINVGGMVTDLDIAPTGTFAIAVLRGESQVVRIPLPEAFDNPATLVRTSLSGEFFGSVTIAPDARRAFLYTTAANVRRLLVMDLAGGEGTYALTLRKTIRAVAYAPDSRTALIVHNHTVGDPNEMGLDLQTRIDRSFAYTLVDPAVRFAKLQLTSADVGPLALVPDGSHAFVLLRDDLRMIADVHRVSMRSFVVQTLQLGSPPSSVGSIPATQRVFVGQVHPEGRITFIDWTTGTLQSVTGFELNSRIVM